MVVIIQIVGMENQHSFIVLEQLIVIGASFLGPKLCVTLGAFSNWCCLLIDSPVSQAEGAIESATFWKYFQGEYFSNPSVTYYPGVVAGIIV